MERGIERISGKVSAIEIHALIVWVVDEALMLDTHVAIDPKAALPNELIAINLKLVRRIRPRDPHVQWNVQPAIR